MKRSKSLSIIMMIIATVVGLSISFDANLWTSDTPSGVLVMALTALVTILVSILITLDTLRQEDLLTDKLNRLISALRSLSERIVSLSLPNKANLTQPPGTRILRWMEFFCSPATYATYEDWAGDFREEYLNDLSKGRRWRARWTTIRHYYGLVKMIGLAGILRTVKQIVKLWTTK